MDIQDQLCSNLKRIFFFKFVFVSLTTLITYNYIVKFVLHNQINLNIGKMLSKKRKKENYVLLIELLIRISRVSDLGYGYAHRLKYF